MQQGAGAVVVQKKRKKVIKKAELGASPERLRAWGVPPSLDLGRLQSEDFAMFVLLS